MKQLIHSALIIFLELSLLAIIIILAIKIIDLSPGNEKVKGIQSVINISKENIIFSSDSANLHFFYEPKPNSINTYNPHWLGYEIKNTINSDGLNERKDYSISKPDKTYRIVTLGDSFTYGMYVKTPENYSEVLEDLLNNNLSCSNYKKFEVINLGVGGYDIEYSVYRFMKRGTKYSPDLVVWLINYWNFERINEYLRPIMDKLGKEGIPLYNEATHKYELSDVANRAVQKRIDIDYILKYNNGLLVKIREKYKGHILILTLPNFPPKYKNLIDRVYLQDPSKFHYNPLNIDIKRNNQYRLEDDHPNKAGHTKIAEDLFDYLLKNFLTDCKVKS